MGPLVKHTCTEGCNAQLALHSRRLRAPRSRSWQCTRSEHGCHNLLSQQSRWMLSEHLGETEALDPHNAWPPGGVKWPVLVPSLRQSALNQNNSHRQVEWSIN